MRLYKKTSCAFKRDQTQDHEASEKEGLYQPRMNLRRSSDGSQVLGRAMVVFVRNRQKAGL